MSEIALKFVVANIAATAAVLLILVLRRPVRARFGARIAYALWLLVPLAAFGSLLPPRIVEIVQAAPEPIAFSEPPPFFAEPAPLALPAPALEIAQSSPPLLLDPWTIALAVWLAGTVAMAGWLLRGQRRFMEDARAGFAGPAVAGVLKPRIITPADFEERFDASEREVILAHEAIHIGRNDARINAAAALARCLCWFNPLIHVAAHVMRVDQELACDAVVVERHPRARAIYAGALLKTQLAARPLPLGCYWPARSEHPLTERVEMLKRERPSRSRRLGGSAAIVFLAAAAGLTAWAAKPPEERFVEARVSQDTHADQSLHIVAIKTGRLEVTSATGDKYVSRTFQPGESYSPRVGSGWTVSADDGSAFEWRLGEKSLGLLAPAVGPVRSQQVDAVLSRTQVDALPGGAAAVPVLDSPAPAPQQAVTAPKYDSQELPPPPMQQMALPAPENEIVAGPPPVFDANSPVYLRGKVEKIDFGDTKYVVFLRASSIARSYGNGERTAGGFPGFGPAFANTDLWEFSPTNYFGNRDSIEADLMGKNVEASGVKTTKDCKPACRIKVNDLIMPRSSQAPQPRADESLLTQFGYWYDTAAPQIVRGKVERIEFSDRTFDAYIRSESRGVLPGKLYQARSEYRFPKADIERELLNKTVVASGWRAREGINTFCDPVCGLYANSFQFLNQSQLTPAGATLMALSPLALRPRGGIYMSIADFRAPITLKGKITRYVPNALGIDNPQLWIEASGVSPETTFGSKAGTVWVVAGFPFEPHDSYDPTDSTRELRSQAAEATARIADLAKRYSENHPEMAKAIQEKAALETRIADELWVGKNVTIRGFNAEDKRCQPQCLMAGNSIGME